MTLFRDPAPERASDTDPTTPPGSGPEMRAVRLVEACEGVVAVRGSAVAWRDHVIVVPGEPGHGTGTGTLLRALLRAGATAYCTGFVLLGQDGRVLPYPGRNAAPGLPLALVASLAFDPATGWDVRPLSTGHTVLTLADHAVTMRERPREVMDHVLAAVPGSTGVSGTRGEAEEAAQRILGSCPTS
jgi:hypothetical protein